MFNLFNRFDSSTFFDPGASQPREPFFNSLGVLGSKGPTTDFRICNGVQAIAKHGRLPPSSSHTLTLPRPRPASVHFDNVNVETGKREVYNKCTVRAEVIIELILESSGPVILRLLLLEFIAFRVIPIACSSRRAKPENKY